MQDSSEGGTAVRPEAGKSEVPDKWTVKPWWFPGYPSLRDVMTSAIALVIVVFWAYALAPMSNGTEASMRAAQVASATLGPILGAVLGYYFGVASGEKVAQQAERRMEGVLKEQAQNDQQLIQMKAESEQTAQAMTRLKILSEQELAAVVRRYELLQEEVTLLLDRLVQEEARRTSVAPSIVDSAVEVQRESSPTVRRGISQALGRIFDEQERLAGMQRRVQEP